MSNENKNGNSNEQQKNSLQVLTTYQQKNLLPSIISNLATLREKLGSFSASVKVRREQLYEQYEEQRQKELSEIRAQQVEESPEEPKQVEEPMAQTEQVVVDDEPVIAQEEPTVEAQPQAKEAEEKTEEVPASVIEQPQEPQAQPQPEPEKPKAPEKPEIRQTSHPNIIEVGDRRIYVPSEEPKPRIVRFPDGQTRGPRPQGQGNYGRNAAGATGNREPRPTNNNFTAPAVVPPSGKPKTGGEQKKKAPIDEKKSKNKATLIKKGYIADNFDVKNVSDDGEYYDGRVRTKLKSKKSGNMLDGGTQAIESAEVTTDKVAIKVLSEKIGRPATDIVKKLFSLGQLYGINDVVPFDIAELVCIEFGVSLTYNPQQTFEDKLMEIETEIDNEEDLKPRPPVVVIMGHVDHGKTSLLDYIRHTNVVKGEAGGITQHIGAYSVVVKDQNITFLDTPGHEAFTAMRERGAKVTDIAILVVAADDGIKPQTVEAINHAKAANVDIIVAINKMDKPTANPDAIYGELAKYDIVAEEWGGNTPVVKVSAKVGTGIDTLLETILLVAEMKQLRANPNRSARGAIIEAKLDPGKGSLATVLVQSGTLKSGDNVVVGRCYGKVRTMQDYRGKSVRAAGPSMPVSITGLSEVPMAGDVLIAVDSLDTAKRTVNERMVKDKEQQEATFRRPMSMSEWIVDDENKKKINIIIKADVQGSVEALKSTLTNLSTSEIDIVILHSAVGAINENDVALAKTTNAFLLGFNVRPDAMARASADQKGVKCNFYRVIYEAVDDIKAIRSGLIPPKYREIVLGEAVVRQVYKITGVGTVAGCYVTDGKIVRNSKVRLMRDNVVVYEGDLSSLKRFKDSVAEVAKGYECGMSIANYNDIKEEDVIECFNLEEYHED